MIAAYIDCRHVTIMATGSVVFHGSLDDLHALAPAAEFMLTTRDPERVLAVCRAQPQITAARAEGPVVHFIATEDAVERLALELGRQGVSLRSLAPTRAPLETLFFQLTGSDAHLHIAPHEEDAG